VGENTDLAIISSYPQTDLDVIAIEELDLLLADYTHDLLGWISSLRNLKREQAEQGVERIGRFPTSPASGRRVARFSASEVRVLRL
jgi:hypothetical protein